jgi:hypothetical protein
MNMDLIAQMSCNPAIGGVAKGHLVREVDALGGIMGEVADAVGIQFRLLNTSRGPAVWSPRAQCDKQLYRVKMREVLEAQPGLHIRQAEVVNLVFDEKAGTKGLGTEGLGTEGLLGWNYDRPQSVGRVRAFYGNTGMFIRALAYTLANGPDGLRQTTEDAVLNANYIRAKLEDLYELPYKTASMHEVVFSDKRQAVKGVKTGDIAKRLIDYGFHPYTVSFPLIVHGALMIEPTESESLEELDLFIDAMRSIAKEVDENPELVKTAPHSTRVSRLDEVLAARKPILRWKPVEDAQVQVPPMTNHSAMENLPTA